MTDTTWPPIMPLDTLYGPRFPVEALPTPFRVYANSLAEAYQVPVDLPALLMLTAASVPLAKRVQIKAAHDWIEPANLYTAVVLPPASRKSAIFKAVTEPLDYYEQQLLELHAETIADARQKRSILEKELKKAEQRAVDAPPEEKDAAFAEAQALRKRLPAIPNAPRILADDVSQKSWHLSWLIRGGVWG